MATIVNQAEPNGGNGMGVVLGVVLVLLVGVAIYLFGRGMWTDGGGQATPKNNAGTVQQIIPDEVDVNINSGSEGGDGQPTE